jgi:hypothetical protein
MIAAQLPTQEKAHRFPPLFWFAGAALALAALLPLPGRGRIAGLPSTCPFYHLTGLPCPGCGLTRSFVCLAHGHWREAFSYHPLGPVLFGACLAYVLFKLANLRFTLTSRQKTYGITVLAAAMLVAWTLRLCGVCPLPYA